MKSECRKIIKETLMDYSRKNNEAVNLASEAAQDMLAEALEQRIKEKFHIFRINRLMTGD